MMPWVYHCIKAFKRRTTTPSASVAMDAQILLNDCLALCLRILIVVGLLRFRPPPVQHRRETGNCVHTLIVNLGPLVYGHDSRTHALASVAQTLGFGIDAALGAT